MMYVPAVPNKEEINQVYKEYGAFKTTYSRSSLPRPLRGLASLWRASASLNIQILEATGGLAAQRLAEVGCLYGSFLELARSRGASVLGIELDEDALQYLDTINIRAQRGLPLDEPKDIVCAFNVLEHLQSPRTLLDAISQILVPGGRVLIEVPNGGEACRLGPTWVGFRVDLEHLNYFTPRTLAQMLQGHGLWVEQYWEHSQPGLSRTERRRTLAGAIAARMGNARSALEGQQTNIGRGTYQLTVLAVKA